MLNQLLVAEKNSNTRVLLSSNTLALNAERDYLVTGQRRHLKDLGLVSPRVSSTNSESIVFGFGSAMQSACFGSAPTGLRFHRGSLGRPTLRTCLQTFPGSRRTYRLRAMTRRHFPTTEVSPGTTTLRTTRSSTFGMSSWLTDVTIVSTVCRRRLRRYIGTLIAAQSESERLFRRLESER